MTHEQKDLLLKDLCSRLPYGVVIQEKCVEQDETFLPNKEGDRLVNIDAHADLLMTNCGSWYYLDEVKPYLFPLSSMTEEQYYEMQTISGKDCLEHMEVEKEWRNNSSFSHLPLYEYRVIDFFIKNHFDYRGLIPMGLAIDATGRNIY